MAKYPIKFNGTWDYTSGIAGAVVILYNRAGEVVTDTTEAAQWEIATGTILPAGTFANCAELVSIEIPEGVAVVGTEAFLNNTSLEYIVIPNTLTQVNVDAFTVDKDKVKIYVKPASSLEAMKLVVCENTAGNDVIMFGYEDPIKYPISFSGSWDYSLNPWITDNVTFYNDANEVVTDTADATQWTVRTGTLIIGEEAFSYCSSLRAITLPESITSIERAAFAYCSLLTSFIVPSSVTTIGDNAFEGCIGLISVAIPNSITRISNYMFDYCISLAVFTIPNTVIELGEGSFRHCEGLTSIIIPNSVSVIRSYAFKYCTILEEVIISDSITTLEEMIFEYSQLLRVIYVNPASSLESMKLIMGVNNADIVPLMVGRSSLYGPKANINFNGSWDYSSNTWINDNVQFYDQKGNVVINTAEASLWAVDEVITTVGASAFADSQELVSISIPETMTSLGEGVFENAVSLSSVEIPDSITSIENGIFNGCDSLTAVYVDPASSLETMKTVMEVNNPESIPLMYSIPDPITISEVIDGDGNLTYPITHANAVFVSELNDEGKNKNIATVLDEIVENQQNIEIHPGDKVLNIDIDENLTATLGLEYDTTNQLIKLTGKNDIEIASFSAGEFIKDAFLKSASYDSTTKELVFVFVDVDKTETTTRVDVGDLVDSYTSGNGIEVTSENVINIKINTGSQDWISANSEGLSVTPIVNELNRKNITFIGHSPFDYVDGDLWILPDNKILNSISYQKGEILTTKTNSSSFQEAHWTKLNRYVGLNDIQVGCSNLLNSTTEDYVECPHGKIMWQCDDPNVAGKEVSLSMWIDNDVVDLNRRYVEVYLKANGKFAFASGVPTWVGAGLSTGEHKKTGLLTVPKTVTFVNESVEYPVEGFGILTFNPDYPESPIKIKQAMAIYGNVEAGWEPSTEDKLNQLTSPSQNLLPHTNDENFVRHSQFIENEKFGDNLVYGWDNTDGTVAVDINNTGSTGRSIVLNIKRGDSFTYSFWAKGTQMATYFVKLAGSSVGITMKVETSLGDNLVLSTTSPIPFTLTNGWKFYWVKYTILEDDSEEHSKYIIPLRVFPNQRAYISRPMFTKGNQIPEWQDNFEYTVGTENIFSWYGAGQSKTNELPGFNGHTGQLLAQFTSKYVSDFGFDDAIEVTVTNLDPDVGGKVASTLFLNSKMIRNIPYSVSIYCRNLNDFPIKLHNNHNVIRILQPGEGRLVEFSSALVSTESESISNLMCNIITDEPGVTELKFNWSRKMVVIGDKVGPYQPTKSEQEEIFKEDVNSMFFTGTQAEYDADPNKDNYILASII